MGGAEERERGRKRREEEKGERKRRRSERGGVREGMRYVWRR